MPLWTTPQTSQRQRSKRSATSEKPRSGMVVAIPVCTVPVSKSCVRGRVLHRTQAGLDGIRPRKEPASWKERRPSSALARRSTVRKGTRTGVRFSSRGRDRGVRRLGQPETRASTAPVAEAVREALRAPARFPAPDRERGPEPAAGPQRGLDRRYRHGRSHSRSRSGLGEDIRLDRARRREDPPCPMATPSSIMSAAVGLSSTFSARA